MKLHLNRIDEDPLHPMPDAAQLNSWANLASVSPDLGAAVEVSFQNLAPANMQAMNDHFRSQNKVTNVLSFPLQELHDGRRYLGDIAYCGALIEQEAIAQKKSLKAHWAHLVIHAMLHLQGHDHKKPEDAKRMEAIEIRLLATLGIANPYTANPYQDKDF